MKGKRRCRIHGGKNTGAPKGNMNAWKHGMRSKQQIELRASVAAIVSQAKKKLQLY